MKFRLILLALGNECWFKLVVPRKICYIKRVGLGKESWIKLVGPGINMSD